MQLQVNMTFDTETLEGQELLAQLRHLVLPKLLPANSPPTAVPPALNKPAAKAAPKTKTGPIEKVMGPAPAPEDLNGTGPEAEDDVGLAPDIASMSPGEARDAGLALVRQAYAANHVAPVKALQKKWGIAKFYDIPVEKGHEFYSEAVQLAQSVGIQP